MKKIASVLSLIAAVAAVEFSALPAMADKALSKSDVETIVKQYLDEHPEVLADAMQKFQTKQNAARAEQAAKFLKESKTDLTGDANSPIAGNPKGDVAVVEFFDYHCGYCKKMVPVMSTLMQDDPKLKLVFKELPILSEDSETAARASLAVAHIKPAQYFAYHTALMQLSGKFDEDKLVDEAKKLGVDGDEMKKEMKSDWVKAELQKNKQLASALNIRGTPGFIIGDATFPGASSADDMKKAIKDARNSHGAKEEKKAEGHKKNRDHDDDDKADQGT